MMRCYPLHILHDDNGTLLVTCPVLPEVTSFGEGEDQALVHAVLAVEEALAARMAAWADIPPLVPLGAMRAPAAVLPLQTALKVALYRLMRDNDITRAELQRRLGWHREQVDRLFRLEHASRLDQIEAAFSALGAEVEIGLKPAHAAAA